MILLLNFNLHSSLKKKKKKKQLLTSSLKTPAVAAVAVTYEDIHISNSLMLWGEELNSELQLAAVTGNGQTRDKCETPLHSSNYWRKYPARSRDLKLSWSESGVRLLLCVEEDRHDNAAINTTHKQGSASSEDDEDDGVDVSRGECADCCVLFWKGSVLLLWIGGSAQRRVLFFYTVWSRCVVAGFNSDLFQYYSLCFLLGSVCLITHLLVFVRIFLSGEVTPSGALASVRNITFTFVFL